MRSSRYQRVAIRQSSIIPSDQQASSIVIPVRRAHPLIVSIVPKATTDFGDPIAGLTAAQLYGLRAGLEEFQSVDTPETDSDRHSTTTPVSLSFLAVPAAHTITVTRF
jgi:hypothetical protein